MFILNILLSTLAALAVTYTQPDKSVSTYSASTPHFVPVPAATDMCEIFGSATKTIEVTKVKIASNQTTAGANQFHLIKRSTANSGGSSVSVTPTGFDSGKPTATASVKYYTGGPSPTTGSSAGTLLIERVLTGISTSIINPVVEPLDAEAVFYQPVVLRGTAQGLVVNFAGVAIPTGMTVSCSFIWLER